MQILGGHWKKHLIPSQICWVRASRNHSKSARPRSHQLRGPPRCHSRVSRSLFGLRESRRFFLLEQPKLESVHKSTHIHRCGILPQEDTSALYYQYVWHRRYAARCMTKHSTAQRYIHRRIERQHKIHVDLILLALHESVGSPNPSSSSQILRKAAQHHVDRGLPPDETEQP